ncbi:MAG: polysaccharide deacetylase family protein [Hyphomonadaceae bacterium]
MIEALSYETPRRKPFARSMTQAALARPVRVRLKKAILSVCFDDFPVSAATTGAAALERVAARGTFYACAGLMGETGAAGKLFGAEDLRRLALAGHEIGCHTHTHMNCAREHEADVLSACALNAIDLSLLGAEKPVRSLAYPYGETTKALKFALPRDFTTARGQTPGLNAGRADLAHLKAFRFYGWRALEPLLKQLERADRLGAWMIVFTHDVAAEPSPWGVPTGALGKLLLRARELKLNILPIADAANRVMAEQN